MSLAILEGWAAVPASGRGIDEQVKAPGQVLVGRCLRGYVEGRGHIATSEITQCRRVGGAWVVRTVTGSLYALDQSIWSQIAPATSGTVPRIGSER